MNVSTIFLYAIIIVGVNTLSSPYSHAAVPAKKITIVIEDIHNNTPGSLWVLIGPQREDIFQWLPEAHPLANDLYKHAKQFNLSHSSIAGGKALHLNQTITFDDAGQSNLGFLLFDTTTNKRMYLTCSIDLDAPTLNAVITLRSQDAQETLEKQISISAHEATIALKLVIQSPLSRSSISAKGTFSS